MKRDQAALRRHFEVERELASRLRAAPREERRSLYRTLYDELFLRVPDHPANFRRSDESDQSQRTGIQLRLLQHFLRPNTVYLEIGPGDCHLARAVAAQVDQVYAVDVSEVIAQGSDSPKNFSLIISDGVTVTVPEGSVDVAFSNQLMEHLHPDDAMEQLAGIYKALGPGGVYVCITPHRFSGPHDISGHFSKNAEGFHLKEYSHKDLVNLFCNSGFATVDNWAGLRGRYFRIPRWMVSVVEVGLGVLPQRLRRRIARDTPLRSLFGNAIVVGYKNRLHSVHPA